MTNVTTNEKASVDDRGDDLVDEQLGAAAEEQALVDDRAVDRGSAKRPSRSEPTRPPTRWTAMTSRLSSNPNAFLMPRAR